MVEPLKIYCISLNTVDVIFLAFLSNSQTRRFIIEENVTTTSKRRCFNVKCNVGDEIHVYMDFLKITVTSNVLFSLHLSIYWLACRKVQRAITVTLTSASALPWVWV